MPAGNTPPALVLAKRYTPDESVVVKPNTIDTSAFAMDEARAWAEGQPLRLLCVSRIDPKK